MLGLASRYALGPSLVNWVDVIIDSTLKDSSFLGCRTRKILSTITPSQLPQELLCQAFVILLVWFFARIRLGLT